MREVADAERIGRFMRALGRAADADGACYLTGGATAVLLGWRESTIDVDVLLVPESEHLLRAIQRIKDELRINIELASPADFIPVPPGWEDRSIFAAREGKPSFYPSTRTHRRSPSWSARMHRTSGTSIAFEWPEPSRGSSPPDGRGF